MKNPTNFLAVAARLLWPALAMLLPGVAFAEDALSAADTAWVMTAAALVILMAPAGLALFYGGQTRRKSALNTIGMSYTAFCVGFLAWVVAGYTIAFGGEGPFIGGFSKAFLAGVGARDLVGTIPETLFACFQGAFAGVAVAIVAGSVVERTRYSTWIIFCALWTVFCYAPVAHFVWGGGFLSEHGELDFAGGTVVHLNAGVAGLVCAALLGRRRESGAPDQRPASLRLTLLGSALLWFGWLGFNAGSALAADEIAANAFLVTTIAASAGGLGWLLTEWLTRSRRTLIGTASGVVCGLVAITPAAGFVGAGSSIVIGLLGGVVGYFAVTKLKAMLRADDTLDAFGVHGVVGIFGALATGVFADPDIGGSAGALFGNPGQLGRQAMAVLGAAAYSAVATAICFEAAAFIARGKRVTEEQEDLGMDFAYHGEEGLDARAAASSPQK